MKYCMKFHRKKQPDFTDACVVLALFIITMSYCLIVLKTQPHIPMLLGCVIAAAGALLGGSAWETVEQGMVKGISQSLVSVILLLLIGVLIGVWIEAGVVPAMVYYGLHLLSPRFFLPSTMVICAAVSMVLGSWGTAGTIGLAFMGLAGIMGIPGAVAAGAVISGAYMGDKISPFSDSTNLASSVTGVDVFRNVKHMLPVSGTAFIVSGLLFTVIGQKYAFSMGGMEVVEELSGELTRMFSISPANFIPLALLLICILFHMPSIPGISIGILSAAVFGFAVQHSRLQDLSHAAYYGYLCKSGNTVLGGLLTAGGIESMMESISLIICAMMFGGMMEETGLMQAFMRPLISRLRGKGSMIAVTVLSCMTVNICLPEQYVAIALPGRMFCQGYDERKIDRIELARALGAGGAAFSPVIPWNTCGVFMAGVLGVPTLSYMRFAYLNLLTPLIAVAAGYLASFSILRRSGRSADTQKGQREGTSS